MPYVPTAADFEVNEPSKSPRHPNVIKEFLEGAANVGNTFRLPEVGGGILQGALSSARSAANVPLGIASYASGHDVTLPNVDLSQYVRQDPMSRAAFTGGDIASGSGIGIGLFNALRKAGGITSSLGQSALGSGLLGTIGQNDDIPYSRAISAGLGALAPIGNSVRSAQIVPRALENKRALTNAYGNRYNALFNKIENERPLSTVELPHNSPFEDEGFAYQALAEKNNPYFQSFVKYLENPTVRNAHTAQSDLGKLSRKFTGQSKTDAAKGSPSPSSVREFSNIAREMRDSMRQAIHDELSRHGAGEHLNEYKALTEGYSKEVAPYLAGPLAKYEQGKIGSTAALKQLLKDERFMRPKGPRDEIAGLKFREWLAKHELEGLAKKAAVALPIGGALTAAGLGGYLKGYL